MKTTIYVLTCVNERLEVVSQSAHTLRRHARERLTSEMNREVFAIDKEQFPDAEYDTDGKTYGAISYNDTEERRYEWTVKEVVLDEDCVNRESHRIIACDYGEVMLKKSVTADSLLDVFNGDNFDEYIGSIDGSLDDDSSELRPRVNNLF